MEGINKPRIDPYTLDVPNIQFSLLDSEDDRHDKGYSEDRINRGFDDSETWALDCTISAFIIPRLERYKEIHLKMLVDDTNFVPKIDQMLHAFKLIIRDEGSQIFSDKEKEEVQQGLYHFYKNFLYLTW